MHALEPRRVTFGLGGGHLWLSMRAFHFLPLVRLVKLKEKKKKSRVRERESLFPVREEEQGGNQTHFCVLPSWRI